MEETHMYSIAVLIEFVDMESGVRSGHSIHTEQFEDLQSALERFEELKAKAMPPQQILDPIGSVE